MIWTKEGKHLQNITRLYEQTNEMEVWDIFTRTNQNIAIMSRQSHLISISVDIIQLQGPFSITHALME